MSSLINVSDDVYEALTRIKKAKDASYSEVIREILQKRKNKKKYTLKDLVINAKMRDKGKKVKIEKIDHDLIAYGVSRDGSG